MINTIMLSSITVETPRGFHGDFFIGGAILAAGILTLIITLIYWAVESEYDPNMKAILTFLGIGLVIIAVGIFMNTKQSIIEHETEDAVVEAISDEYAGLHIVSVDYLYGAIRGNGRANIEYISDDVLYSEKVQVVATSKYPSATTAVHDLNLFILEGYSDTDETDEDGNKVEKPKHQKAKLFTPCTVTTCSPDGKRTFK